MPEPTTALDDLGDRIDWIVSLLQVRTASDDAGRAAAMAGVIAAQARLAARGGGEVAHTRLRDRLGLSETELQLVWVLAAAALDDRAKTALIAGSGTEPAWSSASLRRAVYGTQPSALALRELGPHGALRTLGILERNDGGAAELHESRWTWTLSRRILEWLHGDDSLDPALAHVVRVAEAVPPLEALAIADDAVGELGDAMAAGRATVIVAGMPGLGRRTLCLAAARRAGLELLVIDARALASEAVHAVDECRRLARECRLLAAVPLLVALDAVSEPVRTVLGRELVARLDGLVLATSGVDRPMLRWDRPTIGVDLGAPSSAQREALWLAALGTGTPDDAEILATTYPLAPALVRRVADAARARVRDGRELTAADVAAGLRTVLEARLGQLATRVTVTQTWADLVLSREQIDPIIELVARVRWRRRVYEQWGFAAKVASGLAVTALFSGPPGTGKTMVASLIARDLGLELYRVDLANVVSKYIGETEKHLAALFDAAEAGHAILLFDEADSLFGKRTEVRSSNDRHANLETNYLLQRLDRFTGICLLTSNHETSIDPAFARRLSLHLRFELPDADERTALWRAMLPAAAPVNPALDLAELGQRYVMSGGYIRNASLRAAFLAANDGAAIDRAYLERAARSEYESMGKIA